MLRRPLLPPRRKIDFFRDPAQKATCVDFLTLLRNETYNLVEVINHIAAVMISDIFDCDKVILIVHQINDRCSIDPCDSYSNVDHCNLCSW